jgi:hypothetical protein
MIHKYLANIYLAYNFIVGSIYLLWIMLLYYNKCECSKHILEKIIHVYWYVIFFLDILLFFGIFQIKDIYLIIIGNLLGLGNIYLTYRYMKYLKETDCKCSNSLLKDLIIIIYIFTASIIAAFFIGLPFLYLKHYIK